MYLFWSSKTYNLSTDICCDGVNSFCLDTALLLPNVFWFWRSIAVKEEQKMKSVKDDVSEDDFWWICECERFVRNLWGICERLITVVGVVFLILFFNCYYLYLNIKMILNVSFEFFVTCVCCLSNWKRVWNNRYFQRSPVWNFCMRTNLWHDNLFIYPK